jgi:hypothetical protein
MPSYKYNGMIPDDDPRYQEGITIMIGLGLNEKSKQKSGKNKEKVTKVEVDRIEEDDISLEK